MMNGLRALARLSAAIVLVMSAQTANADGDRARSLKDHSRPMSWAGFYIGANAGLATGDTQGVPDLGGPPGLFATDYNLDGAIYGGQVGYNWQTGLLLLGVEGSLSGTSVQGSTTCAVLLGCKREIEWLATVTGRVGYVMGNSLLYGLAGVAWGDVSTDVSLLGTPLLRAEETHVGWIAGFGLEHALSKQISARIEYAHVDLGSETHALAPVGGGPFVINDAVEVKWTRSGSA